MTIRKICSLRMGTACGAGGWCAVVLLSAVAMRPANAQEPMLAVGDVFEQQVTRTMQTPNVVAPVTAETRADVMSAHRQYVAAIAAYKAIQPETAGIANKLGVAYEHMFMNSDARASFERSVKMDRNYGPAYNNLGTIYYQQKNYKKAERYYKKAVKLDPQNALVFGNLGTLYLSRRKFHDGTEAYQRAYALNAGIFQEIAENGIADSTSLEDLAYMNYCFAKIFAQAGKNDLAVKYLQKAVEEGFHDKSKLAQDEEFATLRGTPEFDGLLVRKNR
ncbi:MAG: tetratricopeptide repeat protein [Acidobacteriota bacterium]|nr:tetratricopeptide repeat protein [Acidobacteriota bacterium]